MGNSLWGGGVRGPPIVTGDTMITVSRCPFPTRGRFSSRERWGGAGRDTLWAPDPGANMPLKTNAIRLLEQLGVAHEVRSYTVDLNDLTARTVASKIGLPLEQVFKTLVVRGDPGG